MCPALHHRNSTANFDPPLFTSDLDFEVCARDAHCVASEPSIDRRAHLLSGRGLHCFSARDVKGGAVPGADDIFSFEAAGRKRRALMGASIPSSVKTAINIENSHRPVLDRDRFNSSRGNLVHATNPDVSRHSVGFPFQTVLAWTCCREAAVGSLTATANMPATTNISPAIGRNPLK